MTTATYNAAPCAILTGKAGGRIAGQPSYVLYHHPKSFDWRQRSDAPHPLKKLPDDRFAGVLSVLNQIRQIG